MNSCDCGALGYKKDGSGWYCLECEAMVRRVTSTFERVIVEQRQNELDAQTIDFDLFRKRQNMRNMRDKQRRAARNNKS